MNAAAEAVVPDRALELVRPLLGELVTPFIRAVTAAMSLGYILLGWQPLAHPSAAAFDRPIFEVLFTVAAPQAWGIAFLVVAGLLILTTITGRAGVYLVAIVLAAGTLAAWASIIIYTALTVPEALLTLSAGGLYTLCFVAIIGLALSPRQIKAERPIIARLERDDADVNVVELDKLKRGA